MGSKLMIKGKRSKRQRFASTMAMAAPSSSSSTSSGGTYTTCSNNNKYSGGLISSTSMMSTPPPHESNISVPTNSVELQFTKSTQVEQDMANCLILLAQGQKLAHDQKTQAITMPGLYNYNVFRCKTCERAFPSFQALGGHRASHKRPKPAPAVQKVMVVPKDGEQHHKLSQFSTCTTTTLSLKISSCNNKSSSSSSSSRVHECSICGSEFASGQALGGHMRRHRSTLVLPPPPPIYDHGYSKKQPTNILSLDLNVLPPLEDESEFPFPLKEQVIVLPPSALVN